VKAAADSYETFAEPASLCGNYTPIQRPRYVRDAVFVTSWTTEQAARDAQIRRAALPADVTEDASALHNFAADMRLEPLRH
jgi:hypothetical protein